MMTNPAQIAFRDDCVRQIERLKSDLHPLVSGKVRCGSWRAGEPPKDTTQKRIDFLSGVIKEFEDIVARFDTIVSGDNR